MNHWMNWWDIIIHGISRLRVKIFKIMFSYYNYTIGINSLKAIERMMNRLI